MSLRALLACTKCKGVVEHFITAYLSERTEQDDTRLTSATTGVHFLHATVQRGFGILDPGAYRELI